MPSTFRTDLPARVMPLSIRRLARTQLGKAADILSDDRQALSSRVHEMRTSIKKVRALVVLARPEGGHKARAVDRRLRKLARRTGALRDAEMAIKTFERLVSVRSRPASTSPAPDDRTVKAVQAALLQNLRDAEQSFHGNGDDDGPDRGAAAREEVPRALAARLLRERRRTGRWVSGASSKAERAGRAAAGLIATYRRARRAMGQAYRLGSGEGFHDWRKAVKAYRYQLQFLVRTWPAILGILGPGLPALERLGELLGDEHDLTILESALPPAERRPARGDARSSSTPNALEPGQRDLLLRRLADRRGALRAEARPLGERLFAERPRDYQHRLRTKQRAHHHGTKIPSAERAPLPTNAETANGGLRDGETPSNAAG